MTKQDNTCQIYLSGGGDEHQSFALDNFFLHNIPHGGTLLYVPIALRGHRLYAGARDWLLSLLTLHGRNDITIWLADDLTVDVSVNEKEYDALYIGGGNTWSLIKEICETKFDEWIVRFLKTGRPVYGGSAGAILFGAYIDTHTDENTVAWDRTSGLNLLNGYSVACHYMPEQQADYTTWVETHSAPLICLPEDVGVLFDGKKYTCLGSRSVTIIDVSGAVADIQPNDIF